MFARAGARAQGGLHLVQAAMVLEPDPVRPDEDDANTIPRGRRSHQCVEHRRRLLRVQSERGCKTDGPYVCGDDRPVSPFAGLREQLKEAGERRAQAQVLARYGAIEP